LTLDTAASALADASIAIIRAGQGPSGAYVASPDYPVYRYAWFRDGAYCALAMDAVGETASADRFHSWAAGVIVRQAERIESVVAGLEAGRPASSLPMLPARYTLDGDPEPAPVAEDAWPNFQLDGYGTWLFALERHGEPVRGERRNAVALAARYLAAAWELPCYDYWEEFGDRRHTSTLAAVAAGLASAARILDDPGIADVAAGARAALDRDFVRGGAFVKGAEDDRVDASLLSLATPFGLVAPDDPRMRATLRRIADELRSPSGGIRRYVGDTFYGGNPWVMLTGWWGWNAAAGGDLATAREARAWVEQHASADGRLAEQLTSEPQAPEFVEPWVERWGPVADPLLWSQATYLLLSRAIEEAGGERS
jgi:GH15 family glucan-1,4-alpha-glucosidase